MLQYTITNREILSDKRGRFIKPDGGKTLFENLKFRTFDTRTLNLFHT